MLYKYSDFINEGSITNPSTLYWNNNEFKKVLGNEWSNISVKLLYTGKHIINFKIGNDKYDYYSVIIENKGTKDRYYLEDEAIKSFTEKFNTEFWKNAPEYVENMKYDPKCLGDVEHVRDSKKYNL